MSSLEPMNFPPPAHFRFEPEVIGFKLIKGRVFLLEKWCNFSKLQTFVESTIFIIYVDLDNQEVYVNDKKKFPQMWHFGKLPKIFHHFCGHRGL